MAPCQAPGIVTIVTWHCFDFCEGLVRDWVNLSRRYSNPEIVLTEGAQFQRCRSLQKAVNYLRATRHYFASFENSKRLRGLIKVQLPLFH